MKRATTVVSLTLSCAVALAAGSISGCSAAKDSEDTLKAKTEEGVDASKQAIEKAAEKTEEALVTAGKKTGEALEAAANLDKSKGAVEKAAKKTGEAVATAGEKTKEGLEKAGEGLQKAGGEVTDAWILGRIKAGFIGKDVLKGSDIDVDSDQHVVTLKGTVVSEAGRARAIEIAKNTEGVKRVVDRLVIGPKRD